MKIIETVEEFKKYRASQSGCAFVPTMGALHSGHASLLKRARQASDQVVASIFVNPTQFNDPNDFQKYPKTWTADIAMLENETVDVLFAPTAAEMYHDKYRYMLTEKKFSQALEGNSRPGHFDGVLTVVMKLFQIIQPTHAYFGEKDFQQLKLIQGMVEAFFLPVKIVPCQTIREMDGLAMSSRNIRLTSLGRAQAPEIYKAIRTAATAAEARLTLEKLNLKVEYVEDVEKRRFAAVIIDDVRLIDNVEI